MIRTAVPEDQAALVALEQEAFGDSADFCRLIFETLAGWQNIWLDEAEDGTPAAMALAVPVTLGEEKGLYLYALATQKKRRGTGRMTALLQHLKEEGRRQGRAFLCLVPAQESLRNYYAARGFETFFYRQEYTVPIKRNLLAVAEFDDVTLTMLPQLRSRLCHTPAVQLQRSGLVAVLTDYYSQGGCSVRTQDAYGFYRIQEDVLWFDEFFAMDEPAANGLLQACREKTGCTSARILTDDGSLTCYGSGHRLPYGMWCRLTEKAPVKEAYLGMMLEV